MHNGYEYIVLAGHEYTFGVPLTERALSVL